MIKKKLALLIAVVMTVLAIPFSGDVARADMTYVRVLLSTSSAKSITMTVNGTYTLEEAGVGFTGGKLTVSGSGSTVTVTHSELGQLYSGGSVTITRNVLSRDAGSISFSGLYGTRFYLGHFSITAKDSVLAVVNRVPLTHYLYGVVAHEMSNTFPIEALKAQALAAKGYALRRMGGSGSYDIGDTSSDQVYKGYTSTYTNVIAAVDATAADALYYNNEIITCFYAASNGGYMLKPSSVWNGDSPYDGAYSEGIDEYDLKNPSSPREILYFPKAFTQSAVSDALYTFVLGKVTAALSANPATVPEGYLFDTIASVDQLVTTSSTGSTEIYRGHTTATMQLTLSAKLDPKRPTPDITPTPVPTEASTPTPSPTPTFEPTPSPTPTFAPTLTPVPGTEGGDDATPSPTPTFAPTPSPTPTFPGDGDVSTPLPTATPTPETVTFPVVITFALSELTDNAFFTNTSLRIVYGVNDGSGSSVYHVRYGHGVGMSQRGAQQMALEGKNYRDILAYYYGGATIGAISVVSPETAEAVPTPAPIVTTGKATGRIKTASVNFRTGPSTSYKSLGSLSRDTELLLDGMDGDWYLVTVRDTGVVGYIHSNYVTLTSANIVATGVITGSSVNFRSGPSTSYQSLGKLARSTNLSIYGMENGWYKVQVVSTGTTGYVIKNYVSLTSTSVPIATAEPTATPEPPAITNTPAAVTNTPEPGTTSAPTATPTPLPQNITPTPVPTNSPAPTDQPSGAYSATGYINGSAVNIRTGASTSTDSRGKLGRDTILGIYTKVGNWYRVRVLATGLEGYVYARYVTLDDMPSSTDTAQNAAYINGSGVAIRKGPSTSENRIARLSRNTAVTVTGSVGSWYKVTITATGVSGYVFNKYVTFRSAVTSEGSYGVISTKLNLRSAPSTSGTQVLLTMQRGAIVTVHSVVSGWAYITVNGVSGYCVARYVIR